MPFIMLEMCKESYLSEASEFSKQHQEDQPSSETLQQELCIWHEKFLRSASSDCKVPQSLTDAYIAAEQSITFPNILYLLKNMLTIIPATSASRERANSTLKFIKTRLRSTMSQASLNAFVLGYKHKDILHSLKGEELCESFIRIKRRRLPLSNPVSD